MGSGFSRILQRQPSAGADDLDRRSEFHGEGHAASTRVLARSLRQQRRGLVSEGARAPFVAASLAHRLHHDIAQRRDVVRFGRERQVQMKAHDTHTTPTTG